MNARRCQFGLSPECGSAKVLVSCPPHFRQARVCIACGKAFQVKFPIAAEGLSLRPLDLEPAQGLGQGGRA